jgi:hypothetical protein
MGLGYAFVDNEIKNYTKQNQETTSQSKPCPITAKKHE